MMLRGTLLLLLLTGCSSKSGAPPNATASDLGTEAACKLVLSGDAHETFDCSPRYCQLPASDTLFLNGTTPFTNTWFTVDGQFAVGRSYTATDLKAFEVVAKDFIAAGTVTYAASNSIAGSSVALTITEIVPNPVEPCGPTGGTAHGSARVELIEQLTDDAGARSPGLVTLDATF